MPQTVIPGPTLPPLASTTVIGIAELSVAPVAPATPIAAGTNDPRMSDSRAPSGAAGGDLTGTYPGPTLVAVGGGAIGPLGSSTRVPVVTRDATGRVTALTDVAISFPATGGFTVAYDLDFTVQAPQDFKAGGDGTYTIDTKAWVAGDVASSTQAQITAGVGLVLEAGASNPSLRSSILTLAATAQPWLGDFMIEVHRVAAGISGANKQEIVGLASAGNVWSVYTGLFDPGSGTVWLSSGFTSSTGGLGASGPTTSSNLNHETIAIRPVTPFSVGTFSGPAPSGGNFPDWNTLHKRGFVQQAQTSFANDPEPSDITAFFAAITSGAKTTIKRLRVLVRA